MTDTSKVAVFGDPVTNRLNILAFAPNCPLSVAEVLAKDLPAGVTQFELIDATLPYIQERTYRNSWRFVPGDPRNPVTTDMSEARIIHRNHLRKRRKRILELLDMDMNRALETRNLTQQDAIAAEKQALRDVTVRTEIDNATDENGLRAASLEGLGVVPTRHR